METGVLRVVVLLALFLLLTADYSALLAQLFHVMGVATPAHTARNKRDEKKSLPTDDTMNYYSPTSRSKLVETIKNSCLPKLICELNASANKDKLTESEKSLLALIRDTSISVTAEVTSKYHFAAHMGQLIAGVEGNGCHNFYPTCPFPGLQVLHMMKKVKIR